MNGCCRSGSGFAKRADVDGTTLYAIKAWATWLVGMSAEAALTKISVAFRFCFDDVGIGARAVAVVSTYPVVIQCIGSQSGHVAIGYIAHVQILVTEHEIGKISARGHV